jgi:uncharacterized protein YgbK (DUF1537 family)
MSKHPVTPADESDLRVHLSRQTPKTIGLLDILGLELPLEQQRAILESSEVVLIDTMYETQLEGIGRLLDAFSVPGRTLFTVGSSAVEMALGAHWRSQGLLKPPAAWPDAGRAGPLLVASGSCSPVTAGQIDWAIAHGFAEIALDARKICEGEDTGVQKAVEYLLEGRSLILHTGHTTTGSLGSVPAALLGSGLGRLVRGIVDRAAQGHSLKIKRLVIAGGDTSSYAARALGIEAVEMICPLIPGAPLCRVHAPGSPVDGMEINLKGGQVGGEDYFQRLLEGNK